MTSLKQDSTRTLQASGSQTQQPKQEKKEKKETPKLLEFETNQTSTKYVYVGKLPYNQRGATTASFGAAGRNGRQQQQQQSKPKKVDAPEGYVSDGFIYFNIVNGPYGSFADAYQVFKHKKEAPAAAPAPVAATNGDASPRAASPRAASPVAVQLEQHGSTSPAAPKGCSPVPQQKPQQPQQPEQRDKRQSSKHRQQHRHHHHHQQQQQPPQQFGAVFGGQPAPYGFQQPQHHHHHQHHHQQSRFIDPFGFQPQSFGAQPFGAQQFGAQQFGGSRLFADNGFQRLDGSRHHHHHQQQQQQQQPPQQQQNGHNKLPVDVLVGSNRKSEKREHRHKKREHKRKDKSVAPVAANGIVAPVPINPVAAVNGEAVKSSSQVITSSTTVVNNGNSRTTSPSIIAQLVDVKQLASPSVSPAVEVVTSAFEEVHVSSN